ncbi:hypothetical protein DYBT9275_02184 [Dyadobacter sp. CECT 9275]|uniref:Lipoprotein n=1 Tax=Dyadobacter helix TaxID=2822344 RepID=A0A916JBE1_9BACT|nr:hypothetical protein [Dyadobacter sp. CECT 9275]CAG4999236.1 hypothetical protein DYBT9275_02184 [Dyadobacter sp. CECT 9275]
MKNLVLFLILFTIVSCKDKSPGAGVEACGVKDPAQNLPWLKDMIEQSAASKEKGFLKVTLVNLRGEQVFDFAVIYMSCIACQVYHCDGTRVDISKYTPAEIMELQQNVRGENGKRTVVWSNE